MSRSKGESTIVPILHAPFTLCQRSVDDTLNGRFYPVGMKKSDKETTVSAGLLVQWMDATDTSPADFARRLDTTDQVINNWKRRGIPRGRLQEVAAQMGMTYEAYLVDPDGSKKHDFSKFRFNKGNTVAAQHLTTVKIPLISWVQAGNKNAAIDPFPPGAPEEWEEVTVQVSKDAFALRVRGDSMVAPDGSGFPEGSIIVVDPGLEARNGDYVVVRFNDTDEATFKRLVVDGPLRLLKALNPSYPTIQVTEDARLAGVVVEHRMIRRLR